MFRGKEIIEFLVQTGSYFNFIDSDGNTALHYAATVGSIEAVKYLIEAGADVTITNNDGDTATIVAACNDHIEIVDLILASQ